MADTLAELNEKVLEGLKIAREYAKDDAEILELLNDVEASWFQSVNELLKLGRSLYSFKWRDKEESLQKLRLIQAITQKGPKANTPMGNA